MFPRYRHVGFLVLRAALRALQVRPATALLIVGHMRSGSTLLAHLLLSHPDLIGCGERNTPYRDATDLDKLEMASRIRQRAPMRPVRYAVDQVNHDHLTPDPRLLTDLRTRCIFLVREPEPTIRSILELTRRFYEPWSEARVVDYYASRLDSIARYAERVGQPRFLALSHDDLVSATQPTFRRLESFLGLDAPLREDYVLQDFTGRRGDPTEKIRAGHIVRTAVAGRPAIPRVSHARAETAYRDCTGGLGIRA